MSEWKRYRKLPVVISARIVDVAEIIETLEGTMTANAGDYVIMGVAGEVYPCKPEIFAATYEPVRPCHATKREIDAEIARHVREEHGR